MPEGLIVLGCILAGASLLFRSKQGQEVLFAEEMPIQSSAINDCGARSLYLICRISGTSSNLDEVRKMTKTSVTGTSMFDIKEAAEQKGFGVKGVRCSFESLWKYVAMDRHYAILYFTRCHFAPAVQIADKKVVIIDTSDVMLKECSADDLGKYGWDGTALLLEKAETE